MQTVVLDTSVIIRWFYSEKEEFVEKAKSLFIDCLERKIEIFIPELLLYEFLNVLLKSKKLSPSEIQKVLKNLQKLPLSIIPFSSNLQLKTIEIACKHGLTSYDSGFAALAIEKKAIFYTCDKDLMATKEIYIRHLKDYQ